MKVMRRGRAFGWAWRHWAPWVLMTVGLQGVAARAEPAAANLDDVEIRRTTDGIAHVKAGTWRSLGFGVGYAQAQDALCTLAEAFVTYEGRRSWFFGPDARPARDSTFGRPKNLELDFFFRAYANADVLARYRASQPAGLNALIEGFAAGYSRYVADIRRSPSIAPHRPCAHAPWVREITADDIYRRLYAAQVAGGYTHFVSELAGAAPPHAQERPASSGAQRSLIRRLANRIGDREGVGSNVLAFGRDATGEDQAVLLGNPHWYWGGPDRFYQMHLTIPGQLDVAGVAFLGVPVVMIGFNTHVAWSHTVSSARRFGLFELSLHETEPTRVRIDNQYEDMQRRDISVEVRRNGRQQQITRTLYRTRLGPVVDFGALHPAFGWGRSHAFALRDVNEQNYRIFSNFFYWNQANSLDEFIAIQRREVAVPWVNTVAIGRGDGRVWYGDVGAVPNAPDDLRERCATALSHTFARVDAAVPVLDGSLSACDWIVDSRAVQPGALPAVALPSALRWDYVANMNDSHWLTNPSQPLEGFPAILGGERKVLSLRGRMGHRIASELMAGHGSSAAALAGRVRSVALAPRAYSAEQFKDELLRAACVHQSVALTGQGKGGETTREQSVDIASACQVLRSWTGRADADARGALLWDSFWAELEKLPADRLFGVPFSSTEPLHTPRAPRLTEGEAALALALAVRTLEARHQRVDAQLGRYRFVLTTQGHVPLYGGCSDTGYFTVVCVSERRDGGVLVGPDTLANSYMQVVTFGPEGVLAHTLLAHGQDEQAVSGGRGAGPVIRYARKDWLRFPFEEADIAQDPGLHRLVLKPQGVASR